MRNPITRIDSLLVGDRSPGEIGYVRHARWLQANRAELAPELREDRVHHLRVERVRGPETMCLNSRAIEILFEGANHLGRTGNDT